MTVSIDSSPFRLPALQIPLFLLIAMPLPLAFEPDHESRYVGPLLLSADGCPSIQPPDDPPLSPPGPSSLPSTDAPPSNLPTNPLLLLLLIVGAATSKSNPTAAPSPLQALLVSPLSELDPCCRPSGSLSLSPLFRIDRSRCRHLRVKSDHNFLLLGLSRSLHSPS